jgi:hypothetical protein
VVDDHDSSAVREAAAEVGGGEPLGAGGISDVAEGAQGEIGRPAVVDGPSRGSAVPGWTRRAWPALDDRTRWDACVENAEAMTGTRYPADDAWMAARSLFRSDLTT